MLAVYMPNCNRKDYLYNLVNAIKKLAPESHDSHLAALEVSTTVASADSLFYSDQSRVRIMDGAVT